MVVFFFIVYLISLFIMTIVDSEAQRADVHARGAHLSAQVSALRAENAGPKCECTPTSIIDFMP
jgi:hypothetical protein